LWVVFRTKETSYWYQTACFIDGFGDIHLCYFEREPAACCGVLDTEIRPVFDIFFSKCRPRYNMHERERDYGGCDPGHGLFLS